MNRYKVVHSYTGKHCRMHELLYSTDLEDRRVFQVGIEGITIECLNRKHAWELFQCIEAAKEVTS